MKIKFVTAIILATLACAPSIATIRYTSEPAMSPSAFTVTYPSLLGVGKVGTFSVSGSDQDSMWDPVLVVDGVHADWQWDGGTASATRSWASPYCSHTTTSSITCTWATSGTKSVNITISDDARYGASSNDLDFSLQPKLVDVVEADIDTDVPDDQEETAPGCLVALNDDDDDNNGVVDRTHTETTSEYEDDLVPITLSVTGLALDRGCTVRLLASSGAAAITVLKRVGTGAYEVVDISGAGSEVDFTASYSVEGHNVGEATLDLVIYKDGAEIHRDTAKFTVVFAKFWEDSSQDYGYDDFWSPNDGHYLHNWKSVPVYLQSNSDDTVMLNSDHPSLIHLTNTGDVRVDPEQPTSESEVLTLTPMSIGTTDLLAHLGSDDGRVADLLHVCAYPKLTKSVYIVRVSGDNDDVQLIEKGKGKPDQIGVSAGADGTLESRPVTDDHMVGTISAGNNGTLDTIRTGDDELTNGTITSGANGWLDSAPAGDDIVRGYINTGADGICNTSAANTDNQDIVLNNGKPHEICVSPGANALRDTNKAIGDDVSGESIDTGDNGVCETDARALDLPAPAFDSTEDQVRDYLNTVYKQCMVDWNVTIGPEQTVRWDLPNPVTGDFDGLIDDEFWMNDEMDAIRAGCKNDNYDLNVFVVGPSNRHLRPPLFAECGGCAYYSQPYVYLHDGQIGSLAHELGHAAFGLGNGTDHDDAHDQQENLMYRYTNRTDDKLYFDQWDQVQAR